MGSSARAHLAYGYDLGTGEDFKAAERGEYGQPKLPWLPVDEDGDSVYDEFGEEIEKRLLASVGFTEEWAPGIDGYFDRPADEGWDAKLADALTALGITPAQDGPKWLVFPSYG